MCYLFSLWRAYLADLVRICKSDPPLTPLLGGDFGRYAPNVAGG